MGDRAARPLCFCPASLKRGGKKLSKVNLALPSVQIREIRINSITGFFGDAKELVAASSCGALKDRNRSFSQCLASAWAAPSARPPA